jgi:hypothetical protein
MVFLKNRKVLISVFTSLVFLTVFSLVSACKDPVSSPGGGGGLPDTENGETRLVISMHDSQLAASMARSVDPRNIQALNLAVRRIDISNPNGGWLTIMEEARTIDIIGASRADPVVLSDVSVEPGVYKELRLVLSDGSTIKVDGQEHPLRVPSGEQSGLKLKGLLRYQKGSCSPC